MANLFSRALGAAPGVQLNPLQDNSEITIDQRDQFFAGMLRLTRGRIDKPFMVTPRNFVSKCGGGTKLGKKTNAYKNYVAVFEALKNGAAGAVLQRLVGSDAKNKYIVVNAGTSIKLVPTISNGVIKSASVNSVNATGAYAHPTVVITDAGTGGSIVTTVDEDGAIVGIKLSGGSGYTSGATIAISGAGGSGATATITGIKNGSLNNAKVTINNPGTGYPHPTITVTTPGSGTGAKFAASLTQGGKIRGISVIAGGKGYATPTLTTPVPLTITDDVSGTGALATAKVTNVDDGVITAISTGSNVFGDYLYGVPKISIKNTNGAKGSGASAIATVTSGDISAVTVTNGGSNYVSGSIIVTANLATNPTFIVRPDLPDEDTEPYLFAIKDLECFNDGVIISMHCDEKLDSAGNKIDNDKITLRIIDPSHPRQYRYEFTGDLSDDGRDDFGSSTFLPDVVSRKTDNIQIIIGQDAIIHKDSLMYGYDEDGEELWVKSDTMKYFTEGDAAYVTADYVAARKKLIASTLDFAYISSLDTDSIAVIKELAQVSYETNKNLRFDVQGDTVADAISFVDSLNFAERLENHLLHAFWTPLQVEDPTANNGSMQMGSATLNIALACLRNAKKDARGFAPKHYPIMGRNWAVNKVRKNIRQLVTLNRAALNQLARAKINPVVYEDGNYIFSDAITCADVDVSLRKLIAVTDMSTSIDDAVVRFCNNMKGYPIDEAIKQTKDYLKTLFEGAEAAGWLVRSDDPDMLGKSHKYEVFVSPERPYDVYIVNYWLRYQGTARQIFITQTYTR